MKYVVSLVLLVCVSLGGCATSFKQVDKPIQAGYDQYLFLNGDQTSLLGNNATTQVLIKIRPDGSSDVVAGNGVGSAGAIPAMGGAAVQGGLNIVAAREGRSRISNSSNSNADSHAASNSNANSNANANSFPIKTP